MLGFINKYRENPKRMVLTLKCKKSLFLLRQGQLNCGTDVKNMVVKTPDYNSSDNVLETNFSCFDDGASRKDDSIYAFDSCENVCEVVGNFEQFDSGNCEEKYAFTNDYKYQNDNKNVNNYCKTLNNKTKFFDKTTKGAYVCEKTYRALLFDVVAVAIGVVMLVCIVGKLLKRKYWISLWLMCKMIYFALHKERNRHKYEDFAQEEFFCF